MLKFIAPTSAWLRHVATASGAAIAILGVLAGLSADDQTKLLAGVGQLVDGATNVLVALGTIAGVASALWARWTAKPEQQVKAVDALPNATVVPIDPTKPVTAGAPGGPVSSHWLAGVLALILLLPLAACGGAPGSSSERQATAATITASYTVIKSAVVLYAALPACTDVGSGPACSNPAIARELTRALAVADTAVVEARAQILAAPDRSSAEKWSAYALAAIDVLAKALATYGVK